MKKSYSKPEIVFESFSPSVNIAANCDVKITNSTREVCGIEFDGEMIFVEGVTLCEDVVVDGTGGLCYHNPTETTDLFAS